MTNSVQDTVRARARRRQVQAFLLALVTAASAGSIPARDFPEGFRLQAVPGSYFKPTAMAFAPDGTLFVADKTGRVFVTTDVAMQTPAFIDLQDEVNALAARGMLGLALHPGFVPDGGPTSWVYLLYTVSPVFGEDWGFDQDDMYSFGRLTRYRAIPSGTAIVADLASRQILLGHQLPDGSVPDCFASLSDQHSTCSMHFADDGSLILAHGDGAQVDPADFGGLHDPGFDDWIHPVSGLRGPTPAIQDSGAFRAQDVRSLAGKILRIDPETGFGYASNPFYDGDVTSNASRVWALGLRNPFRLALLPGTGATDPALGQPNVIAIGDVGKGSWEEISICRGGENFGWPCMEGPLPQSDYLAFDPPVAEFPNCNTSPTGTDTGPILTWHHTGATAYEPPGVYVDESGMPLPGFIGRTSVGGAVYPGGDYPDTYDGRIFFADYGDSWIKTIELDADYGTVAVRPFTTDVKNPVDVQPHPLTGDLHVIEYYAGGRLLKIVYEEPSDVTPYGCAYNPAKSLVHLAGTPAIGTTITFGLDNPWGTQAPGSGTLLTVSAQPDPAFPCGTLTPGLGMGSFGAAGEVLVSLDPDDLITNLLGAPWTGPGIPAPVDVPIPALSSLIGQEGFVQGAIVDPTFGGGGGPGIGVTEGMRVTLGP